MTIKIGSNIASIQAQRRLGEATASLEKIYERLSSGQRINTASDDAAGLAIADDLNTKNRVYTQAIRNGNDGISVLNIADSALDNLTSVVTRIRELAEQSANGTYSSKQREALDNEAQALSKEFLRIVQTTSFNGVKVFNGSLGDGLRLQLGYGVEGSINASVGGTIGRGAISLSAIFDSESRSSQAVTLGDLNGDGILDLVTAGYSDGNDGYATVRLGTGNGNFGVATSYTTETRVSNALSLSDLNGDGILDLVTAGTTDGNDGYATVRLGSGNGNFGVATSFTTESFLSNALSLGDLNGDGILDLVTAGFSDTSDGYATVRLGTGNGNFGVATSFATESRSTNAVLLGDLNGDGILDLVTAGFSDANDGYATISLGTGNGNFGVPTSFATESGRSSDLALGDLNGDGILDLVTAGYNDSNDGYASVRLGTGNGNFGVSTSFATESRISNAVVLNDLNGDGILDLVTAGQTDGGDGYSTVRLGTGNGNFGAATSSLILSNNGGSSPIRALTQGDINGDGVSDIVTSALGFNGSSFDGKVGVLLGQTKDGLGAMQKFSLKTNAEALQAIGILDGTLANAAKQRGVIGASQSRVSIALEGLTASKENFSAAESRIRDADISAEAANLLRTQILQQAATSVLAQANQAPALALTLLR